MFKWDTLKEVGTQDILYQGILFVGKIFEVELTSGHTIQVWRSDDGGQYFCHGLTFGGKDAPGGAVSPFTGTPVETILREYYNPIPEANAQPGDVLVWKGVAPKSTPHSAVVAGPVVLAGSRYLDEATRLHSKNGLSPGEDFTLEQVIGLYGESYAAYRKRLPEENQP